MKKWFLIVFIALFGIFLIAIYWPHHRAALFWQKSALTLEKEEKEDFAKATLLLQKEKVKEALALIQKYDAKLLQKTQKGLQWRELFISASEKADFPQGINGLLILYRGFPSAFKNHEKSSLLLADFFLSHGNKKQFEEIREQWKGREEEREKWLTLDADLLLSEEKKQEAIDLLSSMHFEGREEAARLIKLALLLIYDEPRKAWEYLNEAYTQDSLNPAIRSYRGKLLEVLGKDSLALLEYQAAIQTNPTAPLLRDQLAEFYLRRGELKLAVETWQQALVDFPTHDFIWLKLLFWSRVAYPLTLDIKGYSLPEGYLKPLLEYLVKLKPGEFWDEKAFQSIANAKFYIQNIQGTFWLKLLQTLKEGKEESALSLLEYNPFKQFSLDPDLEELLTATLQVRQQPALRSEEEEAKLFAKGKATEEAQEKSSFIMHPNPLFSQSPSEPISMRLKKVLLTKEVFSAIFLAAGWNEAGLQLYLSNNLPANLPGWFVQEFIYALRLDRGDEVALRFVEKQPPTLELSLLEAELLMATNHADEAAAKLQKLAPDSSKIGLRASWLLSLLFLEKGELDKAKEAIRLHPSLADELVGKEVLAKIALKEGDIAEGEKIYSSIEDRSFEAKSYFARKAFRQKDFETAERLTRELLQENPIDPILLENYQRLLEKGERQEEKKQPHSDNSLPQFFIRK